MLYGEETACKKKKKKREIGLTSSKRHLKLCACLKYCAVL